MGSNKKSSVIDLCYERKKIKIGNFNGWLEESSEGLVLRINGDGFLESLESKKAFEDFSNFFCHLFSVVYLKDIFSIRFNNFKLNQFPLVYLKLFFYWISKLKTKNLGFIGCNLNQLKIDCRHEFFIFLRSIYVQELDLSCNNLGNKHDDFFEIMGQPNVRFLRLEGEVIKMPSTLSGSEVGFQENKLEKLFCNDEATLREEELNVAIKRGDWVHFNLLLSSGFFPDKNSFNCAIMSGNWDAILRLLFIRVDTNADTLNCAISAGDLDLVSQLLIAGIKPNAFSFYWAKKLGRGDVLERIKTCGFLEGDFHDPNREELRLFQDYGRSKKPCSNQFKQQDLFIIQKCGQTLMSIGRLLNEIKNGKSLEVAEREKVQSHELISDISKIILEDVGYSKKPIIPQLQKIEKILKCLLSEKKRLEAECAGEEKQYLREDWINDLLSGLSPALNYDSSILAEIGFLVLERMVEGVRPVFQKNIRKDVLMAVGQYFIESLRTASPLFFLTNLFNFYRMSY